ncbi:MAG TPA: hypothetical protein PK228_02625 [Saprospiraceae bacterium]|nr:hypothetical protein [Saprospiraceae bacterium]
MTYESNRYFKIWAFTVSHNTLIIRSEMQISDEDTNMPINDFTVDLEFWDVVYSQFPSNFYGISLQLEEQDSSEHLEKFVDSDHKIFVISSEGVQYYIVAAGCVVGKSQWINEHRISNFYLKYDEILLSL